MGLFSSLFSNVNPEAELEGLKKAQEALDERFNKKQISNDFYMQKSIEYRKKREKLENKLPKGY